MSQDKNEDTSNGKSNGVGLQISTVVFLDFEATGLTRPRITEMCLLAVNKVDFVGSSSFPRVVNKLLMCLDPKKPIDHGASVITGLYNDSLEYQQPFDVNTVNLIQSFLNHLAKPICLVAHNGNGFDFPLLLSELARMNQSLDGNLYCADSLEAFRELDGLPRKFERNGLSGSNVKASVVSPVNTPPRKVAEASIPPAVKRKSVDSVELYSSKNGCHDNAKVRKKLEFGEDVKDTTQPSSVVEPPAVKPELVFSQGIEDSDYLMALEAVEQELGISKDTKNITPDMECASDSKVLDLSKKVKTDHTTSKSSSNTTTFTPCPVTSGSGYMVVNNTRDTSSPQSSGYMVVNNTRNTSSPQSNESKTIQVADTTTSMEKSDGSETRSAATEQVSDKTIQNDTTSSIDKIDNDQQLNSNTATAQVPEENVQNDTSTSIAKPESDQQQNSDTAQVQEENIQNDDKNGSDSCGTKTANSVNTTPAVASTSGCTKQAEISSTSSTPNTPVVSMRRKSYRLHEVYKRTFGKYPEVTHSAEADCLVLMQITMKMPRLLEWIDSNAVLLSSISTEVK